MSRIYSTFLKGMLALLPLGATILIIYWLASTAESLLKKPIQFLVGAEHYTPGMGVVVGLAFVFAVGLLLNAFLIRKLYAVIEALVERIPVVKTIYGSFKDLIALFAKGDKSLSSQIVAVRLGEGATQMKLVGFVTRSDCSDLPGSLNGKDKIAVYLPMSYQLGGFTVVLPASAVEPLEMSGEAAMRFALTAGVKAGRQEEAGAAPA